MEQPTTTTAAAACCRLLVRKLPKWLRSEDKESLLRHFGAKEVAVMSSRGKLVSPRVSYYSSLLVDTEHVLLAPTEALCVCQLLKP